MCLIVELKLSSFRFVILVSLITLKSYCLDMRAHIWIFITYKKPKRCAKLENILKHQMLWFHSDVLVSLFVI